MPGEGMQLGLLECGSVEEWRHGGRSVVRNRLLEPDLCCAVLLPVSEEADAVAGGEDCVEVMLKFIERKIFVDRLRELKRRDDIEGDAGDDAKSADAYDRSGKLIGVSCTGERDDFAVAVDKFDGGDDGGEIAVVNA